MPLDVKGFKAQFKDSLPFTHYEMLITPPGGDFREINLRTENIMLPGVAYFSVDNYSAYGNGITYNLPYRYAPQELSVTHTIDEKGKIYETFREWANKIVDLEGADGKFGAYYFDDYTVDATIQVYNRKYEAAATIQLFEIYPTSVDPINMSWGQSDDIAKLSVNYRFTRFKVFPG